jgi:hypothetical protein
MKPLVFIFLLLALASSVEALGFGISPSRLDFALGKNAQASRQLILYNTGDEATFELESNTSSIALTPASGVLPGNGVALVNVTAHGNQPGLEAARIQVKFSNPDSGSINIGLGMAVAVKILVKEATAKANVLVGFLISAIIVISGVAAAWRIRKISQKAQHF